MKKLSLLFTVIIFTLIVNAQDANYSGPAKMFVTNFPKLLSDAKTHIDTKSFVAAQTKVDQISRAIASVKSKDASYNTSSMEEELKKIKEQLEAAKNSRQGELNNQDNATRNRIKIKQLLDELFDFAVFSVRFAETAQATIDA
jgi:hypothetical protein